MIICENLVKIYSLTGIEVIALQGLDLTVQDGEMLGIVGASGSGKSTLLNVLGGLDRPSAGRVVVNDRDLLKLTNAELDAYRRTQVGFVWQQTTRNLVPYLTAYENVQLPMRLTNISGSERRRRALELLESVGLSARLGHLPAQLSGGEQQRVGIAVALANRPQFLLADEPTGEVDTATAQEIYAALRQVNQAYHMTLLIVSHDPNIARHMDRVVAIRDGKTSTETVRSQGKGAAPTASAQAPALAAAVATAAAATAAVATAEAACAETSLPAALAPATALATTLAHHHFEELIVLDSAGRLQIPREYLETLDIGDRVRVELEDNHLTIRPVAGRGRSAARGAALEPGLPSPEELYVEEDAAPDAARRSIFPRFKWKRP